MAPKNTVKDIDRGFGALLERSLGQAELTVGVHADEGEDTHDEADGLTVLDVATIHEFGLGVPRRSFIADWADEADVAHKAQLKKMAKAVLDGKVASVDQGLERLGSLYVGEVQKRMASGIDPPLADSTIKKKGSSVPLISTGQMRSAVLAKVEKK